MSTAVAYLGYGRHGKCHGATLMGAQKLACQKIKLNFYLQFLEPQFGARIFIYSKAVSIKRPYVMH